MSRNNRVPFLFAYLILGIFLLPIYRYQINPDAISYISIAQKYLNGDFKNAINGYWSPLFSWLLMPFLSMGVPSLLASRILLLLIGLFLLSQFASIIDKLNIQSNLYMFALACCSLIVLSFAFTVITPDLLFATIALFYLNLILDGNYLTNRRQTIFLGVIGGLLYLTKSYGLPFFLASFISISLLKIFTTYPEKRKISIMNCLIILCIFSLISGSWILLISRKYGYFTFSTASSYNILLRYPQSLGHPMHWMGLLPPPNCSAISIWEDVSFITIPHKSIALYVRIFSFVKNVIHNLNDLSKILLSYSILSPTLILLLIVYFLQIGKEILNKKIFFISLFASILIVGYLIILIESRYVWTCCFLLLATGCYFLNYIYRLKWLKNITNFFLILIFFLSFSFHPLVNLYRSRFSGRDLFQISTQLKEIGIRGKIASDKNWHDSLFLSFYLHSQYFGEKGNVDDSDFLSQLLINNIDYLFIFDSQIANILSSNEFKLITKINYGRLKFSIFKNLSKRKKPTKGCT